MKKYVGLLLTAVLLTAVFLSLPAAVEHYVPAVAVTFPLQTRFSDKIYASGTVEEEVRTDVTVELPIVPQKVCVLVGDQVEANALLATVDIPATRRAILSLLSSIDGLSAESLSVFQSLIGTEALTALSSSETLTADFSELIKQLQNGTDITLLDSYLPTEIRSPAAGTITSMNLTPGSIALPQTPVCTVSRTDSLLIRMTVPEADADSIQEGDPVIFTASATGNEMYAGSISRIFPSANQTIIGTSQQTVVGFYVTPEADTGRLKPGYSVDGIIRTGAEQIGLVVPYEAIRQDDSNQEYVYVIENGQAIRRDIEVGSELTNGAVVTQGLSTADAIVEDASAITQSGMPVRIIDSEMP